MIPAKESHLFIVEGCCLGIVIVPGTVKTYERGNVATSVR